MRMCSHGVLFCHNGISILSSPCPPGHSQMVQLLLDCGAVATSTDYHTSTALHLACRRGHIAVAVRDVVRL